MGKPCSGGAAVWELSSLYPIQKTMGTLVPKLAKNLDSATLFSDPARIHKCNVVSHRTGDTHFVRNDDHGETFRRKFHHHRHHRQNFVDEFYDLVDFEIMVPEADPAVVAYPEIRRFTFGQHHACSEAAVTPIGEWELLDHVAAEGLSVAPDVEFAVAWANKHIGSLRLVGDSLL